MLLSVPFHSDNAPPALLHAQFISLRIHRTVYVACGGAELRWHWRGGNDEMSNIWFARLLLPEATLEQLWRHCFDLRVPGLPCWFPDCRLSVVAQSIRIAVAKDPLCYLEGITVTYPTQLVRACSAA